MAHMNQIKRKWRRVLERWCPLDKTRTSIKVGTALHKGERVFHAPHSLHILVHAGGNTYCGEYAIETEDHLVLGLIKEGRSVAFVEWEMIHGLELH